MFCSTVSLRGLPFNDIRCVSNLFKQMSAVGGGPEMGSGLMVDGLFHGGLE